MMMTLFKILFSGLLEAGGSITLLKGPKNIVVDTGSPWDKDLLLSGMLCFIPLKCNF